MSQSDKETEEFLLSRIQSLLAQDLAGDAEGWMLTSSFLLPNNFNVQFEIYAMQKRFQEVKPAAYYFEELSKKFPDDPGLLKEMQKITNALRDLIIADDDDEAVFLKKLFKYMSNDMKCNILSTVASHCSDRMEHCCLMLLLLQELPSQLFQHGEKVIDALIAAEKVSHCTQPVNPYRKLIVCNAMPTILYSPNFKLSAKLLYCLLQAAVEYFVCFSFTSYDDIDSDILKTEKEVLGTHSERISNAWAALFVMMKKVGQQLHWSLVDIFTAKLNYLLDMNWDKVLNMIRRRVFGETGDHLEHASFEGTGYEKEVFFCAATIFFYSLKQFATHVSPQYCSKSGTESHHYILVEEVCDGNEDDTILSLAKILKFDQSQKREFQITVSPKASSEFADNLTRSFVMAVKMWELIHRNYSSSSDFAHLRKVSEMDNWPCFQEFFMDMLIYQGCHKQAIEHLRQIHAMSNDEFMNNKAGLQLASCLNFIREHAPACNCLFDIICAFPNSIQSSNSSVEAGCDKKSSSHLHFIAFSSEEILHFCIELLIYIYKKKVVVSGKNSEILGHLLILSQYKWPREEELFLQCVNKIQNNGSFCYSKFFDYVIVPGILEEFMYLTTLAGGSVALDLLPTSTMQVGKQRAVTRGVNKGAKDDLCENMKKQMARYEDSLDDLFILFIKQERHNIQMII